MKKKTAKTIASAMVIAFGITAVPAPAFAESTNIVAETEGKTTLTVSQIQQLAVIYNDTVDTLELNIKQLELQEQMTRNQKRKAQNSLDDIDSSTPSIENDINGDGKIDDWEIDFSGGMNDVSNAASDMMFEQTMSQISQLNDALDQLADGKEDLNDALDDLEHIMRYTSAQLALSIVQLTDSAELIEKQIALIDKSIAIYELQEKLGMTTTINVESQRTSKVEAENQLRDTKEQLDNLKRSLNQLIGRPINNPLEVVPMELSGVINPAPAFTQELINEFVEVNPQMVTLLEEREDLKDSVTSDMGSDEKQDIEYQIQAKNMELKTQRQTAENELKNLIATIEKNAVNYRISKEKLATEQKNYDIAVKKYELGMISQIQLLQNELALAQAELSNLANGYQHYFDWQQFNLTRQGIALNSSAQ